MDPLGNVFRQLIKQARDESVRNATALALSLRKEGMKRPQIEEILYANGFEEGVIAEILHDVPLPA